MDSVYAVIESGVVANVIVWDGNTENWQPPEGCIAVLIPEGVRAGIGYSYDGDSFIEPPPPALTPAEILAANTAIRDTCLANAALAIAPLQDAVDLDLATESESAKLKKWKLYRVEVNRVDLSIQSVAWPSPPS